MKLQIPRKVVRKYLNILPSEPKVVQEEVHQEPVSPSTPSVVEVSADIPTSPKPKSQEEKGPSSRTKLNHPSEVIIGNMNELTLKKCTVDKCVANFVSYSCYLLQVEPTKVEKTLQDEKIGRASCRERVCR